MSEAEPIPPTSSVTALRIPMIKKGEYDLWSMKMRQYIARLRLLLTQRETIGKLLIYCFTAIPDRHLLSFHDVVDARTLWEELDSAYERFQHILSMLELYDAKVSQEDANLKFLRSLPSVWHVVLLCIRGKPGWMKWCLKYHYNNLKENRANGRQEKRIVAIEDPNSKALVATDNNEDIDWTKEFDAEPVTFAMMALTELEEDDWSMEIDAEPMHFGQDGLGDFDWSNTADDTPVSLALMATNSEVPYCSKCSKSYKKLLENYQTERDNFQKAMTEILGYQMSLESLEVMLKTHEKNEYVWGDKYE
ncbi:hypothetical protein Tco_0223730 [Tanacetum coccineum]